MACSCAACGNHTHEVQGAAEHQNGLWEKQDVIRFGAAAALFIAAIILDISALHGFELSFGAQSFSVQLSSLLYIGVWFIAGIEVLQTLIKTAGKGMLFDENFLMTFATIGAFVLGEWTEGAAVMLFYNLGELLQSAAVQKSRRSITNLMGLRPEFVRLYKETDAHMEQHEHSGSDDEPCLDSHDHHSCHDHHHTHEHAEDCSCCGHEYGEEAIVPPEAVPIGSLILVKAGERVPLDGIVVEGSCSFDTASMTGESLPRFVEAGGTVLAGFVNIDGLAVIKTIAAADNTAAAKMLRLVEDAQNRKAKAERLISQFARIYTPIVTIGALALALIPPVVGSLAAGLPLAWNNFVPWISRGLVFLVISCPCAFVISVPLGYFGGLGGAAKKGILIKGADFIDALAKTDAVVFDKTGTLTTGHLTVRQVIPADGITQDMLLELAYTAERHSGHPAAQAVKNYVKGLAGKDTVVEFDRGANEVSQYAEKAGAGVTMYWRGKELSAGSAAFIFSAGKPQPHTIAEQEGVKIFFSYGGNYIGCIICNDSLKPQSVQAIKDLRSVGVGYLEMLTGDTKESGEKIAGALRLDRCSSGLLPHEKVARFEKISAERKELDAGAVCAFAGDGINDAPVLARADIGIAMGAIGTDAAIEAADVVLMNDNPALIAQAIRSARFTRRIVKQNIIMSFAVKIAFLLGGALGIIGLWAAVFADVGVALLAVCNSLRARRY